MSRDTHKFLCSCICLWVHIKNCQTKFDMDKRKQEIVPKVLQYEIARVFISNVETRSYHIAVSRETKQDTLHCGGQIWWKTAEDPCVKSSLMIFLAISQFLIVELCLPQAREMGTEAGGQVQLLSQVCLCPMPLDRAFLWLWMAILWIITPSTPVCPLRMGLPKRTCTPPHSTAGSLLMTPQVRSQLLVNVIPSFLYCLFKK